MDAIVGALNFAHFFKLVSLTMTNKIHDSFKEEFIGVYLFYNFDKKGCTLDRQELLQDDQSSESI
jgi:hypothetical protein